jgi:NAD(P)-dependent dehydrogenase (short-subunit alcohol dehydrogenase family)
MKPEIAALCVLVSCAAGGARATTVLITGSDRGLGLEFVRQYAARGDTVIATCRHPQRAAELQALAGANKGVVVEKLDVSDDADIKSLAARHKGRPIDILINNAGVLGAPEEQTLGTLSRTGFHEVMDVNSFGPLAVSEALRENVIASTRKKIIAITSGAGSITLAGGKARRPYNYQMSKAALDMGMRSLGADLKSQGVVVALVAPGGVDTEMNAAFRRDYNSGTSPPAKPAEAIAKVMAVIDRLDQTKAEQGINLPDGTIIPW